MVTIKCSACGQGAPVGDHYHHFHSHLEPDCIIDHARLLIGTSKYTFNESEYENLRTAAKKMHLNEKVIHDLDKYYKQMHQMCIYEQTKRHAMNSIVGMGWYSAIKNYYKIAKLIDEIQSVYDCKVVS